MQIVVFRVDRIEFKRAAIPFRRRRFCIVGVRQNGLHVPNESLLGNLLSRVKFMDALRLDGLFQTSLSGSNGTSTSSRGSSAVAPETANRQTENGRAGGGAMADYSMLLQLIQTTVDANWEADGGEDSMIPFPQGVWIDADGKLHQEARTNKGKIKPNVANAKPPITAVPALGELQPSEACRWVSLTELDKLISERKQAGFKATPAMELLGGITRIDHVARDAKTGEWFIGGPAGDLALDRDGNLVSRTTKLPPVLLEDLLAVAPRVLNSTGPLGCSIDPLQEKMLQFKNLFRRPLQRAH